MFEPLGLGKEQWKPHRVVSNQQTALPQMWKWSDGCNGSSNFGLWHQGEQKWTSTTSPEQFLPQEVSGRYVRCLTDTQSQTLTTQLITEFIITFAALLFADRKQPSEASIAPSQVQEALTFSNHHFEMLLQLGGTVRVPFDSLRLSNLKDLQNVYWLGPARMTKSALYLAP